MLDLNLVYDVGANNGDYTAYYLRMGYKVIAIDANPSLYAYMKSRFKEEILAGRLMVINTAITDKDEEKAVFYVCNDDGRSSLIKKIAERGASIVEAIELTGRTLHSLFDEFGTPFYCKIDIEGYDAMAITGLAGYPERPVYMSCENSCDSIAEIRLDDHLLYKALDSLVSAGYSSFKLLDQASLMVLDDRLHYHFVHQFSTVIKANCERITGRYTAKYNNRQYELKKRKMDVDEVIAPFGEELPGEWSGYEATRKGLAFHFNDYFNHTRNKQLMFWVDIHAK